MFAINPNGSSSGLSILSTLPDPRKMPKEFLITCVAIAALTMVAIIVKCVRTYLFKSPIENILIKHGINPKALNYLLVNGEHGKLFNFAFTNAKGDWVYEVNRQENEKTKITISKVNG